MLIDVRQMEEKPQTIGQGNVLYHFLDTVRCHCPFAERRRCQVDQNQFSRGDSGPGCGAVLGWLFVVVFGIFLLGLLAGLIVGPLFV